MSAESKPYLKCEKILGVGISWHYPFKGKVSQDFWSPFFMILTHLGALFKLRGVIDTAKSSLAVSMTQQSQTEICCIYNESYSMGPKIRNNITWAKKLCGVIHIAESYSAVSLTLRRKVHQYHWHHGVRLRGVNYTERSQNSFFSCFKDFVSYS